MTAGGQLFHFLRARWPEDRDAWVTLAAQPLGERFQSVGAYPVTEDGLLALCQDVDVRREDADLWLSVCGFWGRPPAKGAERQVSTLACLWADVDVKALPGRDPVAALRELGEWAPSQVTWTGHGAQAYWLLEERLDLYELAGGRLALVGDFLGQAKRGTTRFHAWLCAALGAKLDNVANLDRVMRVPGTWNLKDLRAGRERVACELVWDEPRRFKLADVRALCDAAGVEVRNWEGRQLTPGEAQEAFSRQGTLLEGDAKTLAERLLPRYVAYANEGRDFNSNGSEGRRGRDWTGFFLAQQLNDHYVTREQAEEVLEYFRLTVKTTDTEGREDPLPPGWAYLKVESAYGNPPRGPAGKPPDLPGGEATGEPEREDHWRNTDVANAQRFVRRFGEDLAWTPEDGWLRWDGQRWVRDLLRQVTKLVEQLALEIQREAEREDLGAEERQALARHANRLESRAGIRNTIELAEPEVARHLKDFDQNPWLLNCPNGTLNLETGELREHRREDLLTRLCPTEYHPAARSERWERTVEEALEGDRDRIDFLQRFYGYALTGFTREDAVLALNGPTRTGKSTVVEPLVQALGLSDDGGYACALDPDVFNSQARVNRGEKLYKVRGARLVTCGELERGSRMADNFLKAFSGGDTLDAKGLYRDSFSYRPQAKLVMYTNYLPSSTDSAVHERLRPIPFRKRPAQLDPQLKGYLTHSAEVHQALLAWAVRGCQAWRVHGLGRPDFVWEEVERYVLASDPVALFLHEYTVGSEENPRSWVGCPELYRYYTAWAADAVSRPLKQSRFYQAVEERGYKRHRLPRGGRWVFQGLVVAHGVEVNPFGILVDSRIMEDTEEDPQ